MKIDPGLIAPRLPPLDTEGVPEPERSSAVAFYDNLWKLSKWADDYTASVALLDHAYALPDHWLSNRWSFIAARNGGLALRNFSEHLTTARGLVGKIPAWAGKLNRDELKQVSLDFAERFPRIEKLRHAIAHPEFYSDPTINMQGGGPVAGGHIYISETVSLQDALLDRTYATSINGLSISYDLTKDNAAFLLNLLMRAFSATVGAFRK